MAGDDEGWQLKARIAGKHGGAIIGGVERFVDFEVAYVRCGTQFVGR
jgi:hypothetical protein